MLNSKSEKRLNERLKTLHGRKKKYERLLSNPIKQKEQYEPGSTQQERYKTLVENIPCVVYSAYPGKTGPTTFMSEKWKDWTGYSPEELYRDPEAWPKCIHPDDREMAVETYSGACRDNVPYNLEYRIIHKETGQVRFVHDQGLLSKDEKDNIIRVDGIIIDISERKRVERTLRVSEERFRTMLENLPNVAVQGYGPDGTIHYWNKANESIYDYTAEEAIGKDLVELIIPPEMRSDVREVIAHGARTGEMPPAAELNLMRKDGSRVPVWSSHVVIRHTGKEPELFCIDVDLSELKRTEKALRESEERCKNLFNNALLGLYRTTPDGRILMANPALVQMLGYDSFEELASRNLEGEGFEPQYFRSEFKERVDTSGSVIGLEADWIRHDGTTLSIRESAKAIRDEHGNVLYYEGTVEDITERKRAEQELRRHRDRLEEMVAIRTRELEKNNEALRQYEFMVESAHDAIFFKDRQSRYIIANKKTLESFGLPREKVIGKSDYEIMPDREQAKNNIDDDRAVFKTGKPKEIIKEMTGFDGKKYWFQAVKVPHFDENGNVIGLIGIARDITESKQAEEELRIREQKLRALLNATTESAILVEVDGVILDINKIAAQRLGKSSEELIGMKISDYLPAEIAESRKAHGEEVISSGKPLRFQDEREGRCYDNNIYPVFDDKGKVNAIAVFSQDITERRQAEAALRESEEKFRSLAEQSPNMIFINKKGKVVYANKKCEEVMGYKKEELCSEDFDFHTLIAPESLSLIGDNFTRHIRGEEVQPYDYCLINKNGERIEAINASKLIQYEGQTAILGVVTDITERKRAEQALRESEERLKILFESAPDAIYLVNSEGRFVDGNRAAEKLTGFTREDVIGKNLVDIDLLFSEQLLRAKANLKKVADGKPSGPNEYILKKKDGTRVSVEVRTYPVKIGGKVLSLGIARDITEHKHTEQKLLEHQAELKSLASQLSLTEERERHRLATDLHDQIGQSLVISKIKLDQLRKSSGSDEFNKSLEDISQCLGQIIDDTRALTFDLSYPILYELGFEAAVAEWLADQIQEKHGIRTEFLDDGHNKPLDDDICVLLFRNVRELLINVVKHAQADKVRISVRRIKNNICISVEDDGIGFDPVGAVSLATQRAKYGLFSIRERLEQLGGQIEIDSRMGGGSRIIMKAPLKK